MTPNEGAEASNSAQPPMRVSSSAAICCIVRITDEGRVEMLAITTTTPSGWSKSTKVQFPTESGKTAVELGSLEPEDPVSIVTRCLETEVFAESTRITDFVRPIDSSLVSLECTSSRPTAIISWCVRADKEHKAEPSLHEKQVFAFMAIDTIERVLRQQPVHDADTKKRRSEVLSPPRWVEVRDLLREMQTLHGRIAHAVSALQTLRILARLDQSGRVASEYSDLLDRPEFRPLSGDPARVVEYLVRHKPRSIPQPIAPPRR